MALPILVLPTSSCRQIIIITDVTMFRMVVEVMDTPNTESAGRSKNFCIGLASEPKINWKRFCRKMLTPMAVISSDILGTFRTSRRR